MKQLNEHDAELLSALADGRLQGDDFQQALALASDSEAGQLTWHAYHVVGDVLRSTELADCQGDADFLARLRGRLAEEPQHAAVRPLQSDVPAVVAPVEPMPVPAVAQGRRTQLSASTSASNTRWKLVAGLASVAAVATMGWQWLGSPVAPEGLAAPRLAGNTAAGASVSVAAAPAVGSTPASVAQAAADAGAQPVMLRDPRLDELLAAHRQFGGTSALQMPAGFLRNATFERPER